MISFKTNIKESLLELSEIVREAVQRELIAQGHKLTGKVYQDVQHILNTRGGDVMVEGWYNHYATYLHRGVKPENIPYSPGSGAKRSLYIEALIQYAKARNMEDPKRAAFAIARKHKMEGMPTKASYRFSTTGDRLKFLDYALDKNQRLDNAAFELVGKNVDMVITNILSDEQRRINAVAIAV